MKYESAILKRLIDTYGVVGNPQYISEIIKEFIVQGKECYPDLFTYQSDWLAHIDEFGLNPSYTVTYTGQSIYAPNTLERPVKSAILKGQTLKNEYQFKTTSNATFNTTYNYNDNEYTVISDGINDGYVKTDITVYLEANKNYTFKAKCNRGFNNSNGYIYLLLNNSASKGKKMIDGNTTFTVTTSGIYYVRLDVRASNEPYVFSDLMILEGDYTNKDIPYFEGMQSVQMPVLTTSNEDGTKTNILTVNEDVTLRSNGSVYDELDLLTGKLTQRIDENGEVLSQEIVKTVDLTILDQNGQNVKQLMSFNGGTHFNTGSFVGSPLPTVVVSVETDLEETLKRCSLEGNTL